MQYFFECGNFFNISLAELSLVFEAFGISKDCIKRFNDIVLIVESKSVTKDTLDRIFNRLGGFIRYGEIIDNLDTFLTPYFEKERITFGISILGQSKLRRKDIERLTNEIKRGFKSSNVSSRFILPKEFELNAAQIFNNDILNSGFELCIFENEKKRVYGTTLKVQDINSFIKRDIQRPQVDFEMGVLPQKLARIMCNLTGLQSGIIWDPFCGSGTILMEAAVLGFDVLGSDIDVNALNFANENMIWLSKEGIIKGIKYNLFQLDIYNVEKKVITDLKHTGINAVVCEPFMGPPQRKILSVNKANLLIESATKLYLSLFHVLNEISQKGFRVVIVLPSYKTNKGWVDMNISQFINKKWEVLNKKYSSQDLKWKRINSIIARNIFILEKK